LGGSGESVVAFEAAWMLAVGWQVFHLEQPLQVFHLSPYSEQLTPEARAQ